VLAAAGDVVPRFDGGLDRLDGAVVQRDVDEDTAAAPLAPDVGAADVLALVAPCARVPRLNVPRTTVAAVAAVVAIAATARMPQMMLSLSFIRGVPLLWFGRSAMRRSRHGFRYSPVARTPYSA
jgi:hypothetical protein